MRIGQRNRLIKQFSFYFAEKGYIPTWKEVQRDKNRPQHVNSQTLSKLFKSYSILVASCKKDYPKLLDFTKPSAVDDAAEVVSKPDPLAALRASTTEK